MNRMIKDLDIVAGCKANKPQSQRLLYDRYCRLVMGTVLRYCPNTAEAEDWMLTDSAAAVKVIVQVLEDLYCPFLSVT